MKKNELPALKLLGRSESRLPAIPSTATLETFLNKFAGRNYLIRFSTEDFTSLCPVTGQPDFASIQIEYIPKKRCIESKSLKFYLSSYRQTKSFNEEVVNRILEDLVQACEPRWMIVRGAFAARGGVALSVEAEHGKRVPR